MPNHSNTTYISAAESAVITRAKTASQKNGYSELSILTTARKAGMEDYYDALYVMGSTAIHSGLLSIEEHLVTDANNVVKKLVNEPSHENYEVTVLSASDLMMNAIFAIDTIYNRTENKEAGKLGKRLQLALSHEAECS